MKHHTTILTSRQHELEARLDPAWQPETEAPVVGTGNLVYEMGEKVRAIAAGGIGLVEQLVEAIGLRARLDERVQVFTRHRPYHESDHILTMAYNVLTGGQALEDIDRLRNDVTFLDAVGARRLPDPTTAGDFLRRFTPADVTALMEAQNDARLCVWKGQPSRFRAQAVIDVDGTIVPTTGKKRVYPGFPTLFWGLSVFFVGDLMGKERWTPSFGQVFVTAKVESGVMIQATLG